MSSQHTDFSEYMTCSECGHKKYCMLVGKHYVCYSCHYKNYNGLRSVKNG